MRKIFLFSLVGLLLGVGVVALIEVDPGYVLLAYGNYTVETSLWVGCLLLALFTLAVYLLLRLIRRVLGGKHSLSSWLGSRKSRKGVHLTNRGLINFIEGNWSKSRRLLLRGANGNEAPLLNYLIAARASYQLNEPDKMREYLGAAEATESDAGIAVELTQAELKLGSGQFEQALATLVRARRNAGRHPHVLNLLRKAYEGLKDWQALADLLPELKKYKVLSDAELAEMETNLHALLFAKALESSDSSVVRRAFGELPAAMKSDPGIIQRFLSRLIELDETDEAARYIQRGLKQGWNSMLVRYYGLIALPNSAKQLAQAESWLADHSDDAQLQLCLGRLSARDKLWGKARDYFENSYKLERNAEVCAELGRLLASLGETRVSAAYFREGLLLSESALPELPMPEKALARARQLAGPA